MTKKTTTTNVRVYSRYYLIHFIHKKYLSKKEQCTNHGAHIVCTKSSIFWNKMRRIKIGCELTPTMRQVQATNLYVANLKRASLTIFIVIITTTYGYGALSTSSYLSHSNISTLIYCIKIQRSMKLFCMRLLLLLLLLLLIFVRLFCSLCSGFLSRFEFKSSVSVLGVPRLEYGTNTSLNQRDREREREKRDTD